MIPIVFGLGGLIARVAAAAVIPRIVRALARSLESKAPVRRLEVAPLRENPGPPPAPPVAAPEPEPVLGRVLGSEKQCFKACRYTASYPISRVDPMGLEPVPNVLTHAINIVGSQHPTWTVNVGHQTDETEGLWTAQEMHFSLDGVTPMPIAGVTQNGTSWIHVARLSRILDTDYRFFKYLETVAHELYHLNHPMASEPTATAYGRKFLKNWVNNVNCDDRLKDKYNGYTSDYLDMEDQWGGPYPTIFDRARNATWDADPSWRP